ncbi:MAG: transporter [Epsilonproteobacteria bacterium]|nr:MAG: transporter [Campylobacterota bacterium]
MEILILLIVLVIAVSFLCSILEAVLLSINFSYINVMIEQNQKLGTSLKKLKTNIDESISSILILNTIANTLGATAIGAQAQIVFQNDSFYVIVVSIVLTFAILFLSEIIPKTIGAIYYKQLAPFATKAIRVFIVITYPIVILTIFITKKINNGKVLDAVSREELIQSATLGEESGIINDQESDIIKNSLQLKKVKVTDILTPRSVVFAVQKDTVIKELLEDERTYKFSRVPVYDEGIDDIVGMVLTKSLFKYAVKDDTLTINDIMIEVDSINENIPVSKALTNFIKSKAHLFVVTDSYGQTDGIVTLEDCIETLLGLEIMDELDTTEDMRKLASSKMKQKRARQDNI